MCVCVCVCVRACVALNNWQWAGGGSYYLVGLWSRLVSSMPCLKVGGGRACVRVCVSVCVCVCQGLHPRGIPAWLLLRHTPRGKCPPVPGVLGLRSMWPTASSSCARGPPPSPATPCALQGLVCASKFGAGTRLAASYINFYICNGAPLPAGRIGCSDRVSRAAARRTSPRRRRRAAARTHHTQLRWWWRWLHRHAL